jgi:hypothetical protein
VVGISNILANPSRAETQQYSMIWVSQIEKPPSLKIEIKQMNKSSQMKIRSQELEATSQQYQASWLLTSGF